MLCTVAGGKFYLCCVTVIGALIFHHTDYTFTHNHHTHLHHTCGHPTDLHLTRFPDHCNQATTIVEYDVLQPQCSQPQWLPKVANQHAFCTEVYAHSAYAGKTHSLPKTITASFRELRTTATSKTSDNRSRKGKNRRRKMFTALATCLVEASSIIVYIGTISSVSLMSVY